MNTLSPHDTTHLTRPRPWAFVRAALVSFVLAVCILQALPGHPIRRQHLGAPAAQRTLRAVASLLQSVGSDLQVAALERRALAVSKWGARTRRRLLAPFEPLFHHMKLDQSWGLFLSRSHRGSALEVEALTARGWQTLYAANRVDRLGLGPRLGYRRLRGVYNTSSASDARAHYDGFTLWLARQLFAAHPDYREIRVSLQRMRVGTRTREVELLERAHVRTHRREECS